MSKIQKVKIYYKLRPDRDYPSESSIYFQIHIRFGPLNPEAIYSSREHEHDKLATYLYKDIWALRKGWKYFEIEFDPFKTVSTVFEPKRTWWAFEVIDLSMPYALMDCTPKNCKIKGIKQFKYQGVIPEDDDPETELHPRGLILMDGVDGEYMP